MSCTARTYRRPRPLPVAAHEGSRSDFLARVAAEATAAARVSGAARDAFLANAFRYVADSRTLYAAAEYVARHGGPARGTDGVGPADLDRPAIGGLVPVLAQALEQRTYRPGSVRHVEIAKPCGGTRRLSVMTIADRIVERAVVMVLTPFLDPQFSPTTFGGRPGRSTADALAAATVLAERTGGRVVVTADVRKAFDSVPHDRLVDVLRARLGPTPLTDLMEHMVRSRGRVGVAQGGAASMSMLNLYLDEVLDRPWRERHPGRPLIRWVDDLLIVASNQKEGGVLLADLTELVTDGRMRLKETAAVTDLVQDKVEWLGYALETNHEGNLTARSAESAWENLEENLKEAHGEDNPEIRARTVVMGWINALGPAHNNENRQQAADRVQALLTRMDFTNTITKEQLLQTWETTGNRFARSPADARADSDLLPAMEWIDNEKAATASLVRTQALIVPTTWNNTTSSTVPIPSPSSIRSAGATTFSPAVVGVPYTRHDGPMRASQSWFGPLTRLRCLAYRPSRWPHWVGPTTSRV